MKNVLPSYKLAYNNGIIAADFAPTPANNRIYTEEHPEVLDHPLSNKVQICLTAMIDFSPLEGCQISKTHMRYCHTWHQSGANHVNHVTVCKELRIGQSFFSQSV